MNKLLALFLVAGSLVLTAEERLYEVKYLSGQRALVVCSLINEMVGPDFPGASTHAIPELKAVVMKGTPEAMAKIEEILKKYDVPEPPAKRAPQASFTIYLVRASAKPTDHPHPVPTELDSVIAEMKRSFVYDNYNLYDTIVMPPQTSEIESMLPGVQFNGTPYFYTIRRGFAQVDSQTKTVSVPELFFTLKVPYHSGNEMKQGAASIATGIRIQEGQKLVLGKVKVDPFDNTDVFLVVTVNIQ